ncbi:MAG: class I SAM-dependent methyltransferase [Actinomycetota bacterium]|nr:class I SAM-dependent methyltransferase [Actinomycetota bacterium]
MRAEVAVISPARGFIAEHAHYMDDAGFWEAHAARLGGPVIDLGAAAGRTAIPIALLGIDVIAVDSDPEMLEVLWERAEGTQAAARVTLVEGLMQDAALPTGAALVIVPMNTLQVLVDPVDRAQCFAHVAASLRPGGEFIFDLAIPDLDAIEWAIGDTISTGRSRDPATGDVLVHTAVFDSLDRTSHTLDFRVIVERARAAGSTQRVERRHLVHQYTYNEVQTLVASAGLTVLAVHSGFRGERFTDSSERQVWRCACQGPSA